LLDHKLKLSQLAKQRQRDEKGRMLPVGDEAD
jgi:hypothetical protein